MSDNTVKIIIKVETDEEKKKCHSSLIEAAKEGCTECVKLLMDKEAGQQNDWHNTALMLSARSGHAECVKLLLPHEVSLKDKDGKSALDHAKNDEIRKLIQKYTANN
jgi:ankyrin repeat protein